MLWIDIEQLNQQLGDAIARLSTHCDTKGITDISPGKDQAGIDQSESITSARHQCGNTKSATKDQIVVKTIARIAIDCYVENIKDITDPQLVRP